ncbi:MAG: peptidylprolyl isomerase [Bacteroidales bacterium]|nr:peptidylprolyl isomerase [Bacteroidales bacterium]
MIKKLLSMAVIAMSLLAASCSGSKAEAQNENDQNSQEEMTNTEPAKVEVKTTLGNFTLLLYGDTPKHRDNFLKLVAENFYDSLLFHRVIENFMVQAGDPNSKHAAPGTMLGEGDPGYEIDAEIVFPKHFHKRGALAAARTGDAINPERKSSGSQFYVVTGSVLDSAQVDNMQINLLMDQMAKENMNKIQELYTAGNRQGLMALQDSLVLEAKKIIAEGKGPFTKEMIDAYTTVGGAPHLDGQYTVFGEVISGMDTIEKIEKVARDRNDRPLEDVRILSMKVLE